jgi:hypothetical protein
MCLSASDRASWGDLQMTAYADRAVALARTIADADRVLWRGVPGSVACRNATAALEMAEPAFAAAVPTTQRGALLKLGVVVRQLGALADNEPDPALVRAARLTMLRAIRGLARGERDAMPALRQAAVFCAWGWTAPSC